MMNRKLMLIVLPALFAGCVAPEDEVLLVEPPAPPAICDTLVPGNLTQDDFVCAHNSVREGVTPEASPPLVGMSWNDDLAVVAQAWAESCTWAHNPDRNADYQSVSGEVISVGENLYMSTASTVSPFDAVVAWASEVLHYDYATNSCASGEVCGHYTQLVWRDSLQVGCGTAFCGTVLNAPTFIDATVVVCNYAPGGNIIDLKPY